MPLFPSKALEVTAPDVSLRALSRDNACPVELPGNVLAVCTEAAQRLKLFYAQHQQFTIHDETHSLRIVELMSLVAASVLERLNAIEIALLVLAAYHHDQGMIVDAGEFE